MCYQLHFQTLRLKVPYLARLIGVTMERPITVMIDGQVHVGTYRLVRGALLTVRYGRGTRTISIQGEVTNPVAIAHDELRELIKREG